jgi:uncharacterized protein
MQILRAERYPTMPWKNGQGSTREIAVHPPGASLDSFMWRVSLAQVNAPGPFSLFPQCDRLLCVVSGGPLHLSVANAEPARLTIDSPPFYFPADVATESTILDSPVIDFNVIVRREHYHAHVECRPDSVELSPSGHVRIVFVKAGTARTHDGQVLRYGDTLLLGDERAKIVPDDGGVLLVVTIIPEAAGKR